MQPSWAGSVGGQNRRSARAARRGGHTGGQTMEPEQVARTGGREHTASTCGVAAQPAAASGAATSLAGWHPVGRTTPARMRSILSSCLTYSAAKVRSCLPHLATPAPHPSSWLPANCTTGRGGLWGAALGHHTCTCFGAPSFLSFDDACPLPSPLLAASQLHHRARRTMRCCPRPSYTSSALMTPASFPPPSWLPLHHRARRTMRCCPRPSHVSAHPSSARRRRSSSTTSSSGPTPGGGRAAGRAQSRRTAGRAAAGTCTWTFRRRRR
eukprot:364618-Chlamydomonas_euryale.AAC.4